MKKRTIATKILFWVFLLVLVVQSGIATLGYFVYKQANDESYREDVSTILDSMMSIYDYNLYDKYFEYTIKTYEEISPNKSIEEMSEDERNEYFLKFDGIAGIDYYGDLASYFQASQIASGVDYFRIGVVDKSKNVFISSFAYQLDTDIMIKNIGYFNSIPQPIVNADSENINLFDGVDYKEANESFFSSGRKFTNVTNYDAWVVMDMRRSVVDKTISNFMGLYIILIASFTVFIFIALYIALRKIAINPIKELANKANVYSENLQNGTIKNVFQIKEKHPDEIDQLNNSFYTLDEHLKSYVEKEKVLVTQKKNIQFELDLAKKIQKSALPQGNVHNNKYSLDAMMEPAKEVGGDLYGFEEIDKNNIYFFIGDVSGKGVPAALFMMQAKTLLQENLLNGGLLKAVNKANERLGAENSENLFLTAFIAVFDSKTGLLSFINCGHEPVFIGRNNKYKKLSEKAEIPLGSLSNYEYHLQTYQLKKGDRLFLYTDGVSEAMSKKKVLYGKERIQKSLTSLFGANNEDVLKGMYQSVVDYSEGQEQADDICMLSFTYLADSELILNNEKDLSLVANFVNKSIGNNLKKKSISEIKVVLDELLTNVISYSKEKEACSLLLYYDEKNKEVVGIITDHGIPFNPLSKKTIRRVDDIGGFGISIVKSLVNSLSYKRIGSSNVLLFTKKDKE